MAGTRRLVLLILAVLVIFGPWEALGSYDDYYDEPVAEVDDDTMDGEGNMPEDVFSEEQLEDTASPDISELEQEDDTFVDGHGSLNEDMYQEQVDDYVDSNPKDVLPEKDPDQEPDEGDMEVELPDDYDDALASFNFDADDLWEFEVDPCQGDGCWMGGEDDNDGGSDSDYDDVWYPSDEELEAIEFSADFSDPDYGWWDPNDPEALEELFEDDPELLEFLYEEAEYNSWDFGEEGESSEFAEFEDDDFYDDGVFEEHDCDSEDSLFDEWCELPEWEREELDPYFNEYQNWCQQSPGGCEEYFDDLDEDDFCADNPALCDATLDYYEYEYPELEQETEKELASVISSDIKSLAKGTWKAQQLFDSISVYDEVGTQKAKVLTNTVKNLADQAKANSTEPTQYLLLLGQDKISSKTAEDIKSAFGPISLVSFIPPSSYRLLLSPAKLVVGLKTFAQLGYTNSTTIPFLDKWRSGFVPSDCTDTTAVDCRIFRVEIANRVVQGKNVTKQVAESISKRLKNAGYNATVTVTGFRSIKVASSRSDSVWVPSQIVEQIEKENLVVYMEPQRRVVLATVYPSSIKGRAPSEVLPTASSMAQMWRRGKLAGQDSVIMVGDSGLAEDSCYFKDDKAPFPFDKVDTEHRKVISYNTFGDKGVASTTETSHGTHVAGITAGAQPSTALGGIVGDNGIAFKSKIAFFDIKVGNSPGLKIPPDLQTTYFAWGQRAGAFISTNSWNAATSKYTMYDAHVDEFAFNNPDFLIIFSAGNTGDYGFGTVTSPAGAKNALTVGAAGIGDHPFLSSFSSRGPTRDGRIKPDIIAIGQMLASDSKVSCASTLEVGTSMAAPLVAGMSVLIRQYLLEGYYPSGSPKPADSLVPSAALLRALVISSGNPLEKIVDEKLTGVSTCMETDVGCEAKLGSIPSALQGHGFVDIARILRFPDGPSSGATCGRCDPRAADKRSWFPMKLWDRQNITEGQTLTYSIPTEDFNKVGGAVKIVLVYADPKPDLSAKTQLVNDLDLTVTKCGERLFPNGKGRQDDKNSIEQVVFNPDGCDADKITINVKADRIPCEKKKTCSQQFALVYTQDSERRKTPLCKTPVCDDIGGWEQGPAKNKQSRPKKSNGPSPSSVNEVVAISRDTLLSPCAHARSCSACAKRAGCSWCHTDNGDSQCSSSDSIQCRAPALLISNETQCVVDLVCPSPVIIQAEPAGGISKLVSYADAVVVQPSKALDISLTKSGLDSGSEFLLGDSEICYTATDELNRVVKCCTFVRVVDTTPPVIRCPANQVIPLGSSAAQKVTVTITEPEVSDNWKVLGLVRLDTVEDAFPLSAGVYDIKWAASDPQGLVSSCTQRISVTKSQDGLVCPADVEYIITEPRQNDVEVVYSDPASLNPADLRLVSGPTRGSRLGFGSYTVTFSDGDYCSFNILVRDGVLPSITCPPSITRELPNSGLPVQVYFDQPTYSDNLPGSKLAQERGKASGSLFSIGAHEQTFVVTDAANNTVACSFSIFVVDTQKPSITCPPDVVANMTTEHNAGVPVAKSQTCAHDNTTQVVYPAPVGVDNTPNATTKLITGRKSGELFPFGKTSVAFAVKDLGGNLATCTFSITVIDTISPTITCPEDIAVIATDTAGVLVNYKRPTATDNRGKVSVAVQGGQSGSLFSVKKHALTAVATDGSGNQAVCRFIIDVLPATTTCESLSSCTGCLSVASCWWAPKAGKCAAAKGPGKRWTQDKASYCTKQANIAAISCRGNCGRKAASGCYCDMGCQFTNDCCKDYARECRVSSCKNRCGQTGQGGCHCDEDCIRNGDCCNDYKKRCTVKSKP